LDPKLSLKYLNKLVVESILNVIRLEVMLEFYGLPSQYIFDRWGQFSIKYAVIISNYVCRFVLKVVQYVNAKPVLCDVDENLTFYWFR